MSALILPWESGVPGIDVSAWIAPNATVIGDVTIGAESSLWFNVVVRGDVNAVRIGARTNIQDGSIVHVTRQKSGTVIGDDVSIGHMALIHGCTIENGAFVGMKACVMDQVVVESGAMVAAGAVVTPGKRVLAGQIWAGSPAKHLRDMTPEERADIMATAARYARLAQQYRAAPGGNG